ILTYKIYLIVRAAAKILNQLKTASLKSYLKLSSINMGLRETTYIFVFLFENDLNDFRLPQRFKQSTTRCSSINRSAGINYCRGRIGKNTCAYLSYCSSS